MAKGGILISVIVPVYNAEKYLARCVDSILNQTYECLEVVLVDDGCSDDSGELIDEYAKNDNRVKAVHQKNAGVSSARNAGIKKATGDYITFVDSDDFIELNTYTEVVRNLAKSSCDFVQFSMRAVSDRGRVLYVTGMDDGSSLLLTSGEKVIENYLRGTELSACNYVFKKSIVARLRFDEKMRVNEDAYFTFNVLLHSNSGLLLGKIFYNYFYNNDSSATKMFKPRDIEARQKYVKLVMDNVEQKYPSMLPLAKIRMLKNQNLIGLLLNAKVVGREEVVGQTRDIIRGYGIDVKNDYTLSLKTKMFVLATYLPHSLFRFFYSFYHRIRELSK